jgi:hypothetical protein
LLNNYTHPVLANTAVSGTVSIMENATVDGSGNFKIGAGQTAKFRITASVANGGTPVSGSRYVQLNAVRGDIDSALGTIATYPTVPASSFQSAGTAAF